MHPRPFGNICRYFDYHDLERRGSYWHLRRETRDATAAAAAKSLQSCLTLCNPIDSSPPGSPSLGFSRQEHWKGCHFLLQCMKVKSESEVAQLCPTLRDPMDCSLPGSSVHGIFQARVLEWGAIASSNEFWEISKFGSQRNIPRWKHFHYEGKIS